MPEKPQKNQRHNDEPTTDTVCLSPAKQKSSTHALSWWAQQISSLKHVPRTGWALRGVPNPESVAAHSFGVGLWAWWLFQRHPQKQILSLEKILLLALLHDLPEAGIGDLVPRQRKLLFGAENTNAKQHAEQRFWQEAPTNPTPPPFLIQAEQLWSTLLDTHAPETQVIKQADALDCVMQALFYREQAPFNLHEFAALIPKAAGDDPQLKTQLEQAWTERFLESPSRSQE
ncbi:MAG: HD domain-containing protein [Myxococcota bacterium]